MNATVIEGAYLDWNAVYPLFVEDYIYSTKLPNKEIQAKYDLTYSEFKELADYAKLEHGLSRRPVEREAKHYYRHGNGWIIIKCINSVHVYLGKVPKRWIAVKVVELCKNVSWNVDECKDIVHNWSDYIV